MVGRGGSSDIVAPQAMAGRWRDFDRCPAAPVEDAPAAGVHRFTAAGCAGGAEVVFVGVDGGGHEWFGGASHGQRTVLRLTRQVTAQAVTCNAMTETR